MTLADFGYPVDLFWLPFGFIAPKTLNYLAFQSSIFSVPDEGYFERT